MPNERYLLVEQFVVVRVSLLEGHDLLEALLIPANNKHKSLHTVHTQQNLFCKIISSQENFLWGHIYKGNFFCEVACLLQDLLL